MKLLLFEYHNNGTTIVVLAPNIVEADELVRKHAEQLHWVSFVVPTATIYQLAPGLIYSNLLAPANLPLVESKSPQIKDVTVQNTTLQEGRSSSDTLQDVRNNLASLVSKYERTDDA